jgi:hypothetical protein
LPFDGAHNRRLSLAGRDAGELAHEGSNAT